MNNLMFSYSQWFAPWQQSQTRQAIRNRLKEKQGRMDTSQQAISEEYFRFWLQVPHSNPLQRLVRHPVLLLGDKQKIDEYIQEQQYSQIKYSLLFSSITLGMYWVLLSRKATFQNFFNNRKRWRGWNMVRKVVGIYATFLGWVTILNSHYEKKIPNGLNEMGLFKKYNIIFEQKNV